MKFPEQYRTHGTPYDDGGAFIIPCRGRDLMVIASYGAGWDHVSVSLANRTPNWQEMSYVKSLFWNENECVMQLHVAKSDHINIHNHCLHLWRPQKQEIPIPPKFMV